MDSITTKTRHNWRFGERKGRDIIIVCSTCGVAVEVMLLRFSDFDEPEEYMSGSCSP